MSDKSKLGVIYLSRDRFDFYTQTLPNVLTYYFPNELIDDLEVKKKEELEMEVQSFITRNRLKPLQIVLVLSVSVCFEKDVPSGPQFNYDAQLSEFIDHVPFDSLSAKLYLLEKGAHIVVTNSALFEAIKSAFDKQGLFVVLVIPAFVVKNQTLLTKGLDKANALEIIEHLDGLRTHDMLSMGGAQDKQEKKTGKPAGDQMRLFVLLGVLVLLLVILVVMVIMVRPFG